MENIFHKKRLWKPIVLVFCGTLGTLFGVFVTGESEIMPPHAAAFESPDNSPFYSDNLVAAQQMSSAATLVFTAPVKTLVLGFDPALLLSTSLPLLSGNKFTFDGIIRPVIEYEFLKGNLKSPRIIASACLSDEEIENYAGHLSRSLALPESAEAVIAIRLVTALLLEEGRTVIEIADPADITEALPWIIDGKTAELRRVFFLVEGRSCPDTDYALPPPEIREAYRKQKAMGYEIGIWK